MLWSMTLSSKNYARTFELSNDIVKEKEEAKRGHINFNDSEMDSLWKNIDKYQVHRLDSYTVLYGMAPSRNGAFKIRKC